MMISSFLGVLMSYLCYILHLCLFVPSNVKHVLSIGVTWRVYYKKQELLTLREHLGSVLLILSVFCDVLCFFASIVFFLCLVWPMLPVSRLSIFYCPFGILVVYLSIHLWFIFSTVWSNWYFRHLSYRHLLATTYTADLSMNKKCHQWNTEGGCGMCILTFSLSTSQLHMTILIKKATDWKPTLTHILHHAPVKTTKILQVWFSLVLDLPCLTPL